MNNDILRARPPLSSKKPMFFGKMYRRGNFTCSHIFTNLSSYKCSADNIAYADSDLFANFLILSVSLLNNKQSLKGFQNKFPLYNRNYTNINVENLLTDFENIDWGYNVINHRVRLNEAMLNLIANLTALLDKHAPIKKVFKRKINYIYKPRITKEILPLIIAKNKIAAKRHQCPDKFKKVRNYINNVINKNKSRNEYFKKYFTNHSKNAKKVWEGIRCAGIRTKCHDVKNGQNATM